MALSLEMRASAATKKLESLKRKRGVATLDEDGGRFIVLTREILKVEGDLEAIEQAKGEAAEEAARRRAADAPRRRAEARACRLAVVEALETERLAAVADAEKAARALVSALQRAGAAAQKLDLTCSGGTLSGTLLREPNHSMRLSERLASAMPPLASGSGFFGHLNLGPAQH